MKPNDQIKEQYSSESVVGDFSPLSTGSSNVTKNPQDNDVIRVMQRQINLLQQELRKLHIRHKELHNEVIFLRNRSK